MNMDAARFDLLIRKGEVPDWKEVLDHAFCKRMGMKTIWQYGIAVRDMQEAFNVLEPVGFGPFLELKGRVWPWIERGQPRTFSGHIALAQRHGYEVELLGAGDGSTFYSEAIDPGGKFVLHHIGVLDHNLNRRERAFNESGFPTAVRGQVRVAWPALYVDFIYIDCRKESGIHVEFIDYRLFGLPWRPLPKANRLLARIQRRLFRRQRRTG